MFSGAAARLLETSTRIQGRMAEVHLVTGNFFDVVGVGPALGRTLTAEDDDVRTGGRPVIVLSYSTWQEQFAGDPGVIGCSSSSMATATTSSASPPGAFAA